MMWSTRTPPACRSIALTMARNGCVALLDELVGTPRRLRPVLPELVELVRRCARGDAEREHILQRPGVGPVRVDPDGEVVHDAELHARPHGRRLRRGQLVVELPLQPAVEIDGVGVLGGELGDRGACRVLRAASGQSMPIGAVLLGQRTPDREVVEAAPFALAVRRRTPADGPPDRLTRYTLSSAARLAFHAASRSIRSERRASVLRRSAVPCGCGRAGARRRIRGSPRRADTAD